MLMLWSKDTRKFASGSIIKAGPIALGHTWYDICHSDSEKRWTVFIGLPSYTHNKHAYFPDEQQAKEYAERLITKWFKTVGV